MGDFVYVHSQKKTQDYNIFGILGRSETVLTYLSNSLFQPLNSNNTQVENVKNKHNRSSLRTNSSLLFC